VDTLVYKTRFANQQNHTRNWYLVDADSKVLGRLASEVAKIIRGKNKPDFTPHFNSGDKVIVINAEKVRLTGKKLTDKIYTRYTGYPGGLRKRTAKDYLAFKPEELVKMAVKGMLPKNKLQDQYLKNLHIYTGNEHPHMVQKPVQIEL
jgi:large subunit ribosomal protein L13